MSITAVFYPIIAALVKTEVFLGPSLVWSPVNSLQTVFLEQHFVPGREDLLKFSAAELKSIASESYQVINRWLADNNFSIQLQPFLPTEFGTASILDVRVEWSEVGDVVKVMTPKKEVFSGVHIKKDHVRFFRLAGHTNPIAALTTKNDDVVYLSMLEQAPDQHQLMSLGKELTDRHNLRHCGEFGGIQFPMISLDQEVDISWLKGMQTLDQSRNAWYVRQALQQTKFRMNQVGAHVESAVAISTLRGMSVPKPDHVINKPFLVVITRPGLNDPFFVGYITQDDWKDPGTLD